MVGNNQKWSIGATYGRKTTIEDMQVVQIIRDYHNRYAYMVDKRQYRLEACRPHQVGLFIFEGIIVSTNETCGEVAYHKNNIK